MEVRDYILMSDDFVLELAQQLGSITPCRNVKLSTFVIVEAAARPSKVGYHMPCRPAAAAGATFPVAPFFSDANPLPLSTSARNFSLT